MSKLIELAKSTIETYCTEEIIVNPPNPLPDIMRQRAGTFVSLHTSNGELRGCIGTIFPVYDNLGSEIIHNAIAAATEDPRFSPVEKEELPGLKYAVDVLGAPKKIPDLRGHDPKKYGLIVESGSRKGLLLPDLEGVETAETQFRICCQKGFINQNEKIKLYRFKVTRYTE